jgi:hypothetical protein
MARSWGQNHGGGEWQNHEGQNHGPFVHVLADDDFAGHAMHRFSGQALDEPLGLLDGPAGAS